MKEKKKTRFFIVILILIFGAGIYLIPRYSPRYQTFSKIKERREELKNTIHIYAERKTGGKEIVLKENSEVSQGDIIHLGYYSQKPHYGMIFSINGKDEARLIYPKDSSYGEKLVSGQKTFLDFYYIIDSPGDYESFYAATSFYPFNAAEKVAEIQRELMLERSHHPEKKFMGLAAKGNLSVITLKVKTPK